MFIVILRHKLQKSTIEIVADNSGVADVSKDHSIFGLFAVDKSNKYILYYVVARIGSGSNDCFIAVKKKDMESGTITDIASTSIACVGSAGIYKLKIVVKEYDPSTYTMVVDIYLLDESDNELGSITDLTLNDVVPSWGFGSYTGGGQTGGIYLKSLTITVEGDPNIIDKWQLLAPDWNVYDWVGCPHIVYTIL